MPTQIYVEILYYVEIVLLARNYPAGTLELFPLGDNSYIHRNCTLQRNCPASVKFRIYVEILHYVEIVPRAQNYLASAS